MLPDTHVSSCSTLSQLEPDESVIVVLEIARAIREEKIHWRDNLAIQYIQELCWLAVPRPGKQKQPQIITLQFADFNQNDVFFLARQYM